MVTNFKILLSNEPEGYVFYPHNHLLPLFSPKTLYSLSYGFYIETPYTIRPTEKKVK